MENAMTRGKAAAWLICVPLLLAGPGAVYFFARPLLNAENTENRQLAEMPSLSFAGGKELADSLKAFPSLFNSFYNEADARSREQVCGQARKKLDAAAQRIFERIVSDGNR